MNLTEYQRKALETIKPHTTKEMAIADWALGLSGETAEVIEIFLPHFQGSSKPGELWSEDERMELAKELGDILWYSVALCAELELPEFTKFFDMSDVAELKDREKISCLYECLELPIRVGKINEALKHHIMHKEKELNTELICSSLAAIWCYIHLLSVSQGFTIDEVADLNIAKLSHRYGAKGRYDAQASADRHKIETKFTDTEIYASIKARVIGGTVCE